MEGSTHGTRGPFSLPEGRTYRVSALSMRYPWTRQGKLPAADTSTSASLSPVLQHACSRRLLAPASIHSPAAEKLLFRVCVSVCARALSVLHYVSSDLQRGTEGIFSPRRLELSVKCLSSLIISIRVTGDRAFCSERTYCKNCQMEFVSRSNVSIYSGS